MPTSRPSRGEPAEPIPATAAPPGAWTDCALCGASLPAGHRYLCVACVAESERAAAAILARTAAPTAPAEEAAPEPALADADDSDSCPTCGMRLDPSGRCAGCVTTVRR